MFESTDNDEEYEFDSSIAFADTGTLEGNVWRVVDYEAGVVCYGHNKKEGIDCLPLSATDLDPDPPERDSNPPERDANSGDGGGGESGGFRDPDAMESG